MTRISDPTVELLAIALYEHDTAGDGGTSWPPKPGWGRTCWAALDDEDREGYRRMARGDDPLYDDED